LDSNSSPERVDLYLSRKASATWPGSAVLETGAGFVLRRAGRPEVLLGERFQDARQALALLRRAEAPEPDQP
jgi:hypothetical protein